MATGVEVREPRGNGNVLTYRVGQIEKRLDSFELKLDECLGFLREYQACENTRAQQRDSRMRTLALLVTVAVATATGLVNLLVKLL